MTPHPKRSANSRPEHFTARSWAIAIRGAMGQNLKSPEERRWFRSVYESELAPLLVPAVLTGLFPRIRVGESRKCILAYLPSLRTCVSVIVVISWIFYNCAEVLFRLKVRPGGRIALFRSLCFQGALPLVPVTHWTKLNRVVAYLSAWQDLEARYRQVTGTILVIGCRRLAVMLLGAVFLVSCGTIFRQAYVQPPYWLRYAPAVWYVLFVRYLLDSLWVLTFYSLLVVSRSFCHELRVASSVVYPDVELAVKALTHFRGLWLDLSTLIRDAGNVIHGAYSASLALHFIHLTLCAYSFVAQLGRDWALAAEVLLQGALSMLCTFSIILAAHKVYNQAKNGVRRELERIVELSVGVDIKRQVLIFMKAIDANPPLITLGEFVVVDKAFFSTILVTLISYLVVLLQVQSTVTDD